MCLSDILIVGKFPFSGFSDCFGSSARYKRWRGVYSCTHECEGDTSKRWGLGIYFPRHTFRLVAVCQEDATELARRMPVPYSTNCSLLNKIRKDIQCSTVLDHNILPRKICHVRYLLGRKELIGASSIYWWLCLVRTHWHIFNYRWVSRLCLGWSPFCVHLILVVFFWGRYYQVRLFFNQIQHIFWMKKKGGRDNFAYILSVPCFGEHPLSNIT